VPPAAAHAQAHSSRSLVGSVPPAAAHAQEHGLGVASAAMPGHPPFGGGVPPAAAHAQVHGYGVAAASQQLAGTHLGARSRDEAVPGLQSLYDDASGDGDVSQ
jgi:hypothetical protein